MVYPCLRVDFLRVLVTGQKGYIGSRLVPWLEQPDHDVAGSENRPFAACIFGQDGHELERLRADVRDVETEDLQA
jgi:nucleoside-diphosphate-sugar epimerase